MNRESKQIIFDITRLRIQGASQVQQAGVKAMQETIRHSKAKTIPEFRNELQETGIALIRSRPTEPGLRTAVRIIWKTGHRQADSLPGIKKAVLEKCKRFSKEREQMLERISTIGKKIIPRHAVVMMHCHSNTAEEILKKVPERIEAVYCTETRPLFQGRITATHLSQAGIPVIQIVDSAAASFIGTADLFLTGADAVLANGNVINKIGTREISLAAKKNGVPHFVAASENAFDPLTAFGWHERIEERSWKEVWPDKPKKVGILNPAFDETPASQIRAIISNHGVLKPKQFVRHVERELKLRHDRKEYIEMLRLMKKTGNPATK